MIITGEEIDARLQDLWPGVSAGPPVPLSGGFWASMYRVRVTGQPDGVAPEVVVRFAPHETMGAKEAEVQRALAGQGFPTPTVWASGPDEARDGWWSVMDFSAGTPLLAGIDGIGVLRSSPLLLRVLPAQLAEAMAALHRVDPAPVTDAVRAVAPEVAWSALDQLGHLRAGAAALGRDDVVTALDRLAEGRPGTGREVLCHGDVHPFNVLTRGDELVMLDWTGALVADPCFDVAFTELLLANLPVPVPRPLRAIRRLAGRALAQRFLAAYAAAHPAASLEHLAWFRALHGARVLVEVARLRAAHVGDPGGHPFVLVAPAAASHLTAATGVDIDG